MKLSPETENEWLETDDWEPLPVGPLQEFERVDTITF